MGACCSSDRVEAGKGKQPVPPVRREKEREKGVVLVPLEEQNPAGAASLGDGADNVSEEEGKKRKKSVEVPPLKPVDTSPNFVLGDDSPLHHRSTHEPSEDDDDDFEPLTPPERSCSPTSTLSPGILVGSPFTKGVTIFEPPGATMTAVTHNRDLGARSTTEMLRVRLYTTDSKDFRPDSVRYYSINQDCILSTFAHVRTPRLMPADQPFVLSCTVETDVIIAVHEDNPLFLLSDFQRVITNNSYSRFLASGAGMPCTQKWFRLYHRQLSPGDHTINFSVAKSFRDTRMNQFTTFVRPTTILPPLDIKSIPDDSPP